MSDAVPQRHVPSVRPAGVKLTESCPHRVPMSERRIPLEAHIQREASGEGCSLHLTSAPVVHRTILRGALLQVRAMLACTSTSKNVAVRSRSLVLRVVCGPSAVFLRSRRRRPTARSSVTNGLPSTVLVPGPSTGTSRVRDVRVAPSRGQDPREEYLSAERRIGPESPIRHGRTPRPSGTTT